MEQLDPSPKKGAKGREGRIQRALTLMPHEQRRRLIEAPFASRVHQHSSAWGGVFIRDSIPVDGRRVWKETPEDEEWCRNKWEEK